MGCLNLLFMLLIVQLVKSNDIVQTDSGPVQGTTVASGKVEAFLGVPYAEPPIGNSRFGKPVPKASWEEVYDATRLPPACIQPNFGKSFLGQDLNMSEDCLYLNVWVPRSQNKDELKPVMLFIHGGAFFSGSSSMSIYDGAALAEYGNAVVVTINYRVASLGFFTGFIDEAPGSLGLYDQVMAMQWIKKNVKHFQGDPDLIVLFGESAGAFSISLHQISPLSKHLFRRAILQSGSAVNPLYSDVNKELSKICHVYAELLGCTNDRMTLESNPIEVVNCLKKVPVEEFSEADMKVFIRFKLLYPRIGNDFLPMNVVEAYRQNQCKDSEVLMGITRDEGSLFLAVFRPDVYGRLGEKVNSQMFNETTAFLAIKEIIMGEDTNIDDAVIRSYLDRVNEETGYTYIKAVSETAGDSMITCGTVFQADYQSLRGSPVYYYMFNHRPSSSRYAEWMGVAHFDEVQFVFGNPMQNDFTEYEKELSRDIINMWVTFAKTGNPNIPGGKTWPKYTYQDPKYFIIGMRDRVGVRPDDYRCEKWRKQYRSAIDDELIQSLKKDEAT